MRRKFNTLKWKLQGKIGCWLGLHEQYQPGVCGWCGKPHMKVSEKWKNVHL